MQRSCAQVVCTYTVILKKLLEDTKSEKAKAEELTRDEIHEALKALFAERNSKIDALFDDTQMEIIKIYTALVMQYSKHCGDRKKDGTGDKR